MAQGSFPAEQHDRVVTMETLFAGLEQVFKEVRQMKLHVWNKLLAATLAILAGAILASVGFLLDYLPTSVLVLVGSLTIAAVAIFFVMALFIALCEKFANASDWRPHRASSRMTGSCTPSPRTTARRQRDLQVAPLSALVGEGLLFYRCGQIKEIVDHHDGDLMTHGKAHLLRPLFGYLVDPPCAIGPFASGELTEVVIVATLASLPNLSIIESLAAEFWAVRSRNGGTARAGGRPAWGGTSFAG